ncbi:MAG TPA: DUF4147 domain-containing protein, partial [Planctomycetaceae bacterium]|nr:DUF4147 domain-containing protein [Planctomycetaceae bacterium]
AIVGAGKAGARMAAALEKALGPGLVDHKVVGWVNVPETCMESLQRVHLHAAGPGDVKAPTPEAVEGTKHILRMVSNLDRNDLCIVLLSSGANALLAAPLDSISLEDKLATIRFLTDAGASAEELNTVRKQLSAVKGGKLMQATGAGQVVSLIISDVPGDSLDLIASAPTVSDSSSPAEALQVIEKYASQAGDVPESVRTNLQRLASGDDGLLVMFPTNIHNHVIGNNARALEACAAEAKKRGYQVHSLGCEHDGEAEEEGASLALLCLGIRDRGEPLSPPACLLCGGRFTVHLPKTEPSCKGGRNQELVLAAVNALWQDGMRQVAIVSGDTDGRDGPTEVAGAVADAKLVAAARSRGLTPSDFLADHDSYTFFKKTGRAIKTGPTHTDVTDLCVALVGSAGS